jgi:acylphosphatase
MQRTIAITVTGKVQGVFFRQSTREKATALGVTGTVANRPNGSVYIVATGTAEQLAALTAWSKTGPPKAVVTGVEVVDLTLQVFEGFKILR